MKLFNFFILCFPSLLLGQWVFQPTPSDVDMLLSVSFINANTGVAGGWKSNFGGKAIFTTNSGENWQLTRVPDSARSLVNVQMLSASTGYIAGAYNYFKDCRIRRKQKTNFYMNNQERIGQDGISESYKGLFLRTTDGGQTWNTYGNLPVNVYYLHGMKFINNLTGFVACSFNYSGGIDDGILRTTTGGLSWSVILNMDSVSLDDVFTTDGNNIYVCGQARSSSAFDLYGIIVQTTDGGMNWTRQNFINVAYFKDIFFVNVSTGFSAGGSQGDLVMNDTIPHGVIYKTTNSGSNWFRLPVQIDSTFYYAINLTGSTGIAVGGKFSISDTKIFISRTTNYGISWSHYLGSDDNFLVSLSMPDLNIWFVCGGIGDKLIYKTTTGGAIGIKTISNQVPDEFALYQNYPNPFNPVTKIKFALPALPLRQAGLPPSPQGEGLGVRVIIYDILGREITTLVNEQLQPGTYEVEFDGTNYSSGVYFYTLITEYFNQTKRMMLIK